MAKGNFDTPLPTFRHDDEISQLHDSFGTMLQSLKTFPAFPHRDEIEIYGMLTPAKSVGGDLFDFFLRDDELFFCIGDVSGKGVPASLVIISSSIEGAYSPQELIESMTAAVRQFVGETEQSDDLTMLAIKYT